MTDVCAIGKVDDGTLRVCCSTHQHTLCGHHYAVTHFVETTPEFDRKYACNAVRLVADSTSECSLCGAPIGPGTNRADIHSECFACAIEPDLSGSSQPGRQP